VWWKSEPDLFIAFLDDVRTTFINSDLNETFILNIYLTKFILCGCDFEIVIFDIRVSLPPRDAFWEMLSGLQKTGWWTHATLVPIFFLII
jgi:hypothetical protein